MVRPIVTALYPQVSYIFGILTRWNSQTEQSIIKRSTIQE